MNRLPPSMLILPVLTAAAAQEVPGPEQVVQKQIEAFNAHDLEAFLAVFAEDLEAADLPRGQSAPMAKARLRELYAARFRANPELKAGVRERIVSGAFVIQREIISGRAGKPPLDAVVVYQVEDGRIRRMWTLG